MRVLSLFDGMSCGKLALDRAGIHVDEYYASEIDPYAITISKKNHPDIIHIGDVTKWEDWDFPHDYFDLVIAGSPCQGFSMAGKHLDFEDPRSKLYFTFKDIIDHFMPDWWLLENVKMKNVCRDWISFNLGHKPVMINSELVSAQLRSRYYWANFPITQPKDKGIIMADIMESGVADRDKSFCIDANYWKGTTIEQYIKKHRRQIVFTETRTAEAKRIRREFNKKYGRDFCPRRAKEMVARNDGKMNCLTAGINLKEHTLIDETLTYRMLTPLEAERCQTLPDDYTAGVSNTQRYKMIGNGWTVDVVAHIFKCLYKYSHELRKETERCK